MRSLSTHITETFDNIDEERIDEIKWKGRRQSNNVEDRRSNIQKKTSTFNRVSSMNRNSKPTPKKNPIPYDDGEPKDYHVKRKPL